MHSKPFKAALMALSGAFGIAGQAAAQGTDDEVSYEVRAGDTLNDLASEYLISAKLVPQLMQLNKIRNARRLQVGTVLRIPRSFLRYELEPLRVVAFSGPVTVSLSGNSQPPRLGAQVLQGAVINTGPKGFISLGGTGNSRLSLPSNSKVELREAKRYLINDAIDFDIRVLGGRGETRAPKLKSQERFKLGTPFAVTAVRGTEFRVGYDPIAELSLTEVVEGNVMVSVGPSEAEAEAGAGIASTATSLGPKEALLPAPDMKDAGRIQTEEKVSFHLNPLADATKYRTQLARDAGFIEVIAEQISEDTTVAFDELADGRLFVRSRAIGQSGLEGFAEVYSFRRKRVGASASVEQSPFADLFKFVWLPEGEGTSFAAFQLWDSSRPDVLLIDEVAMEEKGVYIGQLPPASYKWRVGTFQIDDGDIIKVWGPDQDFVVSE